MRRFRRAHTISTRQGRRGWRERGPTRRRYVAPRERRAQQDAIDRVEDPVARRMVRRYGFAPRVR